MHSYKNLVNHVLDFGKPKTSTRGHVDTIGVFGYNTHIFGSGREFPLLTTKEMSWKNIVLENMWFLSGDNHLGFLHKHGVKFWDAWENEDGTVPSAYGNFWRNFYDDEACGPHYEIEIIQNPIDQVAWALGKLEKNPNTRQACITSWDPRNVVNSSLPPCHAFHVLNITGADEYYPVLNLALMQRSCDIALGVPYNIAGYALLQNLYARILNTAVGTFSYNLVDAHIYTGKADGSMAEYDHRPNLRKQMMRRPRKLPRLVIDQRIQTLADVDELIKDGTTEQIMDTFKLHSYDHAGPLKFKAAV